MISTPIGAAARSISISLSSSWPSRSFLRNAASGRRLLMLFRLAPVILGRRDQHVENALFGQLFGTGAVFSIDCMRTILMAASVRSRMMESTSLPT